MNPRVRFEDEADAEYRFAGRWYEERREHLGIEFFDAVDATIDQIVEMPEAGALVPRIPSARSAPYSNALSVPRRLHGNHHRDPNSCHRARSTDAGC